jgi:hypothetical protein
MRACKFTFKHVKDNREKSAIDKQNKQVQQDKENNDNDINYQKYWMAEVIIAPFTLMSKSNAELSKYVKIPNKI